MLQQKLKGPDPSQRRFSLSNFPCLSLEILKSIMMIVFQDFQANKIFSMFYQVSPETERLSIGMTDLTFVLKTPDLT